MTKVPGGIYFLRERDYLTAQISPYVKIGLVRNDKPTEKRILEHQTGNPREIYDYQTIEASFVEDLETRLHYLFGEYWVSGEWFLLDDETLNMVIQTAQEYAISQKNIAPLVYEVEEFSSMVAEEKIMEAKGELIDIWDELIFIKGNLIKEQAIQSIAELKLRQLLGANKGIAGIVEVQLSKPTTSFKKAEFMNDPCFKDYSEQYIKEIPSKLTGSFILKNNPTLKRIDAELDDLVKSLKLPKVNSEDLTETVLARTPEMEKLHFEMIVQSAKISSLDWKCFELETKLKWHTGNTSGIDGVCTWKRELKPVSFEFDVARFKEDHPEIANRFSSMSSPTIKHPFSKFRAYPHL